jgi:hypothetical protein
MNAENINWREEYFALKKASDDLINTLKSMMDASNLMRETLRYQEDTIVKQIEIINGLNELTDRQCTNNKLMFDRVETQYKTLARKH